MIPPTVAYQLSVSTASRLQRSRIDPHVPPHIELVLFAPLRADAGTTPASKFHRILWYRHLHHPHFNIWLRQDSRHRMRTARVLSADKDIGLSSRRTVGPLKTAASLSMTATSADVGAPGSLISQSLLCLVFYLFLTLENNIPLVATDWMYPPFALKTTRCPASQRRLTDINRRCTSVTCSLKRQR